MPRTMEMETVRSLRMSEGQVGGSSRIRSATVMRSEEVQLEVAPLLSPKPCQVEWNEVIALPHTDVI